MKEGKGEGALGAYSLNEVLSSFPGFPLSPNAGA